MYILHYKTDYCRTESYHPALHHIVSWLSFRQAQSSANKERRYKFTFTYFHAVIPFYTLPHTAYFGLNTDHNIFDRIKPAKEIETNVTATPFIVIRLILKIRISKSCPCR